MSATSTTQVALPTGSWQLDPSATTITVTATKLRLFKVPAHVTVLSGTIEIGPDHQVVSAEVIADAASYDSGNDKRDQHIRSADFLDTDHHATIGFRTGKVAAAADGSYHASGSVTANGHTSPMPVDIDGVEFDEVTGRFEASAKIDRTALGIDKMPKFVIGRTLSLTVSAQATLGSQT